MQFLKNNFEETLVHLLWECPHVRSFWNELQTWLNVNLSNCINFLLSKDLAILGMKYNVFTDRVIDLIILMAKYHIFVSKLQGTKPNFNAFFFHLKNRYIMERYRARVDNCRFQVWTSWKDTKHV